jgi:flagellar protein FlaJ
MDLNIYFKKKNLVGIGIGLIIVIFDIIKFRGNFMFWPLIVIAVSVSWATFWLDFFVENKKQKELEKRFPEFVRNLVGAIKSGMPISKSIIHVSTTDYGALTPHVVKLANQLEWAFPFHKALTNFAQNTNNVIIIRAVSTVIEAERSGGNMEDVLESITDSLIEIKKIKLSRQASIHSQLIQSYVIFFVFLGIMIVIQNLLVPYIATFSAGNSDSLTGESIMGITKKVELDFSSPGQFFSTMGQWFISFHGILLMLSMFQGFFAGLVMGKLAEGDLKSGVRHSLILVTLAFLVITLAQGFLK